MKKICKENSVERETVKVCHSVDQFGEIKPLVDRGKFYADRYKRYIRIQADSFMVKW